MALRVFFGPLFLMVAALIAFAGLHWILPSMISERPLLVQLAATIRSSAASVAGVLVLGALLWGANQAWELRQWYLGKGDTCEHCGGMAQLLQGRYGLYWRCYLCGKAKRA